MCYQGIQYTEELVLKTLELLRITVQVVAGEQECIKISPSDLALTWPRSFSWESEEVVSIYLFPNI